MGEVEHETAGLGDAWRFAVAFCALVVVYVATAHAGLLLAIPPGNVTAVWPPSGVAVAALVLGGRRLWPAIVLATLVVTTATTAPMSAGLGFALGNTLEALAAVAILGGATFDATRMSIRDVGRLLLAASLPTLLAALIGGTTLVATGTISASDFDVSVVTWWAGDTLGVLLVAPFLLVWATPSVAAPRRRALETLAVLVTTCVFAAAVFEFLPTSRYLTFGPLLWAAVRLGLRGVVSVSLLLWVVGSICIQPVVPVPATVAALASLGASQLYYATCGIVGLLLGGAINERDRARRELRSRDEWSRMILDRVFDIVAVLDEQGVTQWITPSVTNVLGLTLDEVIGQPMPELVHPDDVERVAGQLARLAAEPRGTARIQARCRHADGGWRVIEARVTNALDNPSIAGFVVCSRDVTTEAEASRMLQQASAAALEAARMRSEFLANVSHELRTPLNVLFGITDMLLDEASLPARHAEQIGAIRQNAAGLLHLIDDILDLAKIDAGRLEVRRTAFEVASVVEEVVAALQTRADAKGIVLATSVAPSLTGRLVGDPERIRQILLNYLTNAIKFTETGTVRVVAVSVGQAPDAVRARFEVHDTGIGVPEGLRHRLFQPFSQVDGSMSRRFGGTGLGLAISKQLAELMGGSVGATSMPGLGSIFWFEVRLERPGVAAIVLDPGPERTTPPESDPPAASERKSG